MVEPGTPEDVSTIVRSSPSASLAVIVAFTELF